MSIANKKSTTTKKTIKEEIVLNDDGLPSLYIFNYQDSGFIIMSAEQNEVPILAYCNEGQFEKENMPLGVALWIETTKENIRFIRKGIMGNFRLAHYEWKKLMEELGINTYNSKLKVIDPDPPPDCEEHTYYTKGPLLVTRWGQGCGYNSYCPYNSQSPYCNRCPTGCVATAMAQVMRYLQHPTYYNWSSMPSNYGNAYVADLMRDVGNAVDMEYLPEGSGAEHQDIDNAFRDKFDYTSATDINYSQSGSYNIIKSELNNNRPVIFSGYNKKDVYWFGLIVKYREGHEWACDGYRTVENPCYGTQLFFNMNWGWDGYYNGWYGFADWYIPGINRNFRYYTRAIINIRP